MNAKPEPQEKIYGWLNTQLSIARYYGGISLKGHSYVIDYSDPQQPLVLVKPVPKKRKVKDERQQTL